MVETYDADEFTSPATSNDPDGTVCSTCDSKAKVTGLSSSTTYPYRYDFGYQPTGSGSIGDTVFKDANGNGIQDGAGETGIEGVTVLLQVDWNGDGNYVTLYTDTTDASGKYLFENLPLGTYRVLIDPSANTAKIPNDAFGNEYYPSTTLSETDVVYSSTTAYYVDKMHYEK